MPSVVGYRRTRLYGRIPTQIIRDVLEKLQDFEIMSLACTSKARLAEESQADVVDMLMAFDIPHKCFGKGAHSLNLVEHHPKDEVQYMGWEFCQHCGQTCDQVLRDQEYDRLHRRASFRRHWHRQGFATRAY